MKGFETPFPTQMENVFRGKTADGADAPVMWALPDLLDHPHRTTFDRVCYWLFMRQPAWRLASDQARTCLIWTASAHLRRLFRNGTVLEFAEHAVFAYGNFFSEFGQFLHQLPAARRMMPRALQAERVATAETRAERTDYLKEMRRAVRTPYAQMPFSAWSEPQWAVFAYRNPWDFLTNDMLAPKWKEHFATVTGGDEADHAYWHSIAHCHRQVFGMTVGGVPAATWEAYGGQLKALDVRSPEDPLIWKYLASAIARLRTGRVAELKYDPNSGDPYLRRLQDEYVRGAQQVQALLQRMKKPRGKVDRVRAALSAARKRFPNFMLTILCALLLPLLVTEAPMFARTYIHAWKIMLGQDPDCAYPAKQQPATGFDCLALGEAP